MGHMVIGPDDRLSLPKVLRDQLGLKPGDPVRVEVDPDHSVTLSEGTGIAAGAEPLATRNLVVAGRRMTLRLEESLWDALGDIGRREGLAPNAICTRLKEQLEEQARRRDPASDGVAVSLVAALRIFIVAYYRHAIEKIERPHPHEAPDLFTGTPFELRSPTREPEDRSSPRKTIDDLIGIGGTFHRAVSSEEMDEAIREQAAARFLGK